MSGTDVFQSIVVGIIDDWLEAIPEKFLAENEAETYEGLEAAISSLGYGTPYDREQRYINEKLLAAKAGKTACLIIWGYYHDYKISEASVVKYKAI